MAANVIQLPTVPSLNVVREASFVAVVGSRQYPELQRIPKLISLLKPEATVVSGGAVGVDSVAVKAAQDRGLRTIVIRPGRSTAEELMNRNTAIVRASDVVVAFWNEHSRGTRDSIEKALLFHGFVVVARPGQPARVEVRV